MCTSILIRHELLRQESIRYFTFTLNEFESPRYLVDCGFYYEPYSKRIYCFSCNFNLHYSKSYRNLSELHTKWSTNCEFINGFDVSIKTPIFHITNECVGWPKDSSTDLGLPLHMYAIQRSMKDPPVLYSFNKTRGIHLKAFYSPIYIPSNEDDRRILDVKYYFKMLKKVSVRLETFKLEGYKYPYSNESAEKLAEQGFFYTLFNDAVQCAYCRIVINGRFNNHFDRLHKCLRENCEVFNPNRKVKIEVNKRKKTEIEEVSRQRFDCVICLTDVREYFCKPCMHLTHCQKCYEISKPKNCVICRKEKVKFSKLFVC